MSERAPSPLLTPEDLSERDAFREILEIMEKQGAIGETQPEDYKDALWYKEAARRHAEKAIPEGDITIHYDTIIFDFDGVLYDSAAPLYEGAKLMLEHYGAPHIEKPKDGAEVQHSFHSPFQAYFKRFGVEFNTDKEMKDFQNYFQTVVYPKIKEEHGEPAMFGDVRSALEKLRARKVDNPNLKICVVSAGREDYVPLKLKEAGLDAFFDKIVCEQADKSAAIQSLVTEFGTESRTAVLGDLPSDIKDTRAIHGIASIGVARNNEMRERLGHYLPEYVIADLSEIFNLKKHVATDT